MTYQANHFFKCKNVFQGLRWMNSPDLSWFRRELRWRNSSDQSRVTWSNLTNRQTSPEDIMIGMRVDQSDVAFGPISVRVWFGCAAVSAGGRWSHSASGATLRIRGSFFYSYIHTHTQNTADMFSRIARPSASLVRCLSTTSQVKIRHLSDLMKRWARVL